MRNLMAPDTILGLGLSCNLSGEVIKLIFDGLDLEKHIKTGQPFISLFDEGSVEKAWDFFKKILETESALDWQLNVPTEEEIRVLHFSGFLLNDQILVVGAPSRDDMTQCMEKIITISSEYSSAFKGVKKESESYFKDNKTLDEAFYAEIGRLNNELSTVQRELTKKNFELNKLNEKLKKSLEEKEMLLKEIHHRVKNNLMIIASLLNIQSRYIKDTESQEIFKESQNRARSMAIIHERLYQSVDLKRIDFRDYVRTLANELFHAYTDDSGRIKLKINLDAIFVDINIAIPLGLIINELITNSLKHAFPDGRGGEITLDFHKKEDLFELTVKDDGVGFPEDLDYRSTSSLGLQLVNSLTEQIDGEVKLEGTNGTCFKITF